MAPLPTPRRSDQPAMRGPRRAGVRAAVMAGVIVTGAVMGGLTPGADDPPPAPTDAPPAAANGPAADADPGAEREAVVVLNGGRRITGTLVEKDDEKIVLRVNGIPTPFGMDIVDRVDILPPLNERYRSMRSAIKDDDVPRLVLLAQWLIAYRMYDDAARELSGVIAQQPEHAEARQLLTLAREQADLVRKRPADPVRSAAAQDDDESDPDTAARRVRRAAAERQKFPVLTEDDVNIIRVYELDLREPPRLLVPREVIDAIIENYADDPLIPQDRKAREALYQRPAVEIVELLFNLKARDLYPLIRVLDHPRSIRLFRDNVHATWLINACSSTQCHGGADAGRLMLATVRPNSDETVYTNLLILERFRLEDGRPLINYDDPVRSTLLQMALPRDLSLSPHPDTDTPGRRWRPVFATPEDRRYQDAVRWIQSMYRPRPDYPVTYVPPKPLTPDDPPDGPTNSGPPR